MATKITLPADDQINEMSLAELASTYNGLVADTDGKPVKKFKDRKTGIRRVRLLIHELYQAENDPELTGDGQEPVEEDEVASDYLVLPQKERIGVHRPSTRRGTLISLCLREGGATLEELMDASGWTASQVRTNLRLINRHVGHGIREDENGFIMTGHPRVRTGMAYDPNPEGVREIREGTKRHTVMLLLTRTGGATLEEVMETTGWPERTALEGIRLLATYVGYGIEESDNGQIEAYTA